MIELKDIQGNVIYTTEINKGAKRKYLLMKEDYITLPFSLETPITFGVGCNTEVNGELFEVTDSQKPTYNNATGGYDYQLRLDAYYWKWKNKIFKFTPEVGGQEASWSLTASLDVHLNVFLANLKALGYTYRGTEFEFSIDATVENKAMSMTYENTNMIDALSAMAESWQCEWWITDNIINFGRCEYGTAVDFEIHKNVAEMTSSASQSPYATRLYVFGSTNNIPTNYRPANESLLVNGVVQKRLMLPEGIPYLDAYEGMRQEEAIEEVVIIEDIYPKTDGKIDSVDTYEDSVENEDGTTTTEIFYRFTDDGINFSKDYIIEGQELKVKFTSGSLNGMEFGVVFNPNEKPEKLEGGTWNAEAQLYEVVINEDYGRKLPDSTLYPKIGDTYVLIGWDSTKIADLGLISKAENELLLEGRKILEKRKIDPNTYNCKMFSDYMFGLNEEGEQDSAFSKIFEIGDKVKLINPAYFENGRESRIIGYEYNLDFPYDSPIYTIGETASYSRLGELENKLNALTYKGQTYAGGNGNGIYIIGTNDTTKPTNKNVFSAARTEKDFLSKQKDDITPFNLGVGKNLTVDKNVIAGEDVIVGESAHSTEFVSGFVDGKGWAIRLKEWINAAGEKEIKSVGEFDEVIVRNSLRVYEFIVSQMLGENDNRIFTGMMEVDHYDAIDGKVYLKTDNGRLYNPFRVDDVIIVQQYGGNPSEENGYYVTKQYEFIVTEVGIGEMDEDRLDWVRFRNFTTSMEGGNESLISERDTLVRIDNLSDANRKGVIQLMSVGEDTPYMDFIYGAKTDPENSLKGRLGNLGGVYNPLFGWLKEFGAYLTNLYAVGEFRIAHTGEDIADAIEILKGTFRTNFSQTSYDITEEADFFTNATFTNDCEYWELSEEDTSYFAVGDVPQFFNYELYASENSFAGLSEYDGRSALRLTNGYAKQLNEYIRKPSTHTEYSGVNDSLEKVGEDVVDTLYLSVRVYAATDSIIELGFTDSNGSFIENDFHHNESLEASKDGYTINLSGKWDGNGDFTIKGTGDVYIDHLSLTDKPLENFRITTFTAIEQTAQSIKLLGTRIDGATGAITQVQQSVNALNGTISSIASTVNGHTTSISNLTISVNGINSTVSTKVGKSEIISSINQSSESVTINANKINLNGTVTANKTFKIDTSGYMTCVGGTIGGFTIKEKRLMASSKVNMILNAGENDDYPSIGWFGSASAAYASLGVVTSGGFLGGQLYLSNTNQESTLFSPSGLSINGTNNTILLSASVTNSSGIPYPAIDITSKKNLSAHVVIGFRGSRISFYSQNWPTTSADVGIGEVYLDGTTLRVRTS